MRTPMAIVTLLMLPGLALAGDGTAPAAQEKKAKQEKDAGKKPVKVYTDDDLKKARETESGNVTVLQDNSGRPAAPGAEGQASPAALAAEALASTDVPRDETSWRSAANQQ
ncbi:MAG TPA: hypothetical protein VFO85_14540, partial [Vicinamibacteria bacterium]|nr:hypothetical protein [Vicinamibacteria bacterium]